MGSFGIPPCAPAAFELPSHNKSVSVLSLPDLKKKVLFSADLRHLKALQQQEPLSEQPVVGKKRRADLKETTRKKK